MRRKVLWLTFWVTMAFWFGQGCAAKPLNESNELSARGDLLPALLPATDEGHGFTGEPSVDGMDRSSWEEVTVTVALWEVEHRPVYWDAKLRGDESRPRLSGAWPTETSALDLGQDDDDVRAQVVEAAWEPFAAALDFLLFPVRVAMGERPRELRESPRWEYEPLPPPDEVVLYPDGD
ncbi:MAG: hypothetical protein ACF8PN_09985 [Phycisphaerales bacterium]